MPARMAFMSLKSLVSRYPRDDWPNSDLSSPKLMEWARIGDPRNFMIIAGKTWPMPAFQTVLPGSKRPLENIHGSIYPESEFMAEVPVDKMPYLPSSTTENFTKPPSATVDAMITGWIKFGGTRHGWEKWVPITNKAPMYFMPINYRVILCSPSESWIKMSTPPPPFRWSMPSSVQARILNSL